MSTTEHTVNDQLAALLRETRSAWRKDSIVLAEETGTIEGSNRRPDLIIMEDQVSPVVIENEFFPAVNVHKETVERLGLRTRKTGRPIFSAIAVRTPIKIKEYAGLDLGIELRGCQEFEFALYTGVSKDDFERRPAAGWIKGNIRDLSILVQDASVPPHVVDLAADALVSGIKQAGGILERCRERSPAALDQICDELCQARRKETLQMAVSILINAFVMQESLANGPDSLSGIKSIDQMIVNGQRPSKTDVMEEWEKILAINYWPIFHIALNILRHVPRYCSSELIASVADTTNVLVDNQLTRSHDLTGAVFQTLLADRNFLAAYYTLPSSSDLMANLVTRIAFQKDSRIWSDKEKILKIKVGDLACGTGTLLSSVYKRIGQVHELTQGDASTLHAEMMANCIVGCDILPSAAHLTASMLSSAHPSEKYDKSGVICLQYGVQPNKTVALGSLDLLNKQKVLNILESSDNYLGSSGTKRANLYEEMPEKMFDLIVMNPPFKRATGHEGQTLGFHNPIFAAFGSSAEEQKIMGGAFKRLAKETGYHGNAGEASCFLFLADRKLKHNGVIGLIMPQTLAIGDSWQKSRDLLFENYGNLIIFSISGSQSKEISFSSDTSMAEVMIVGTKGVQSKTACFVVLKSQPHSGISSDVIAKCLYQSIAADQIAKIDSGPIGGTQIKYGEELMAEAVMSPLPKKGTWGLARIDDISLAQSAYYLVKNEKIWLPGMSAPDSAHVPIVSMKKIGKVGAYHADINGKNKNGTIRGPFDVLKRTKNDAPEYPVLWTHDAPRERTMVFAADCKGKIKPGKNKAEKEKISLKSQAILNGASFLHFNKDFQFNSQSTAMQITPVKTIGGQAWPSIKMKSKQEEIVAALWGNSVLGVFLYWWHSNKQQVGRGRIPKSAIQNMPMLNVAYLGSEKMNLALRIFKDYCSVPFRPINEISVDSHRISMSKRFYGEVLGVSAAVLEEDGPVDMLVRKLAREPSIVGRKKIILSAEDISERKKRK